MTFAQGLDDYKYNVLNMFFLNQSLQPANQEPCLLSWHSLISSHWYDQMFGVSLVKI